MSHIWISHVTHMNESCHTRMNEACHTHPTHMRMRHVTHTHIQDDLRLAMKDLGQVPNLIGSHRPDLRYVRCRVRGSFIWGVRDSFMCLAWMIHVCDVTHACVEFVTHLYVGCDFFVFGVRYSFACEVWALTQFHRFPSPGPQVSMRHKLHAYFSHELYIWCKARV